MNQSEIDLAREDLQTLHAVASANRPTSTTTLKEQLHWADSGSQVRYRLDKLEERGLIETRKDEERAKDHQMPPRVAVTTSAGDEIADEYEDDPEALPLVERVEAVEKQLKTMRDTYGEVKERIVDLEEDVEQHDDDLEDISQDVRDIRRSIESSSPTTAGDEL